MTWSAWQWANRALPGGEAANRLGESRRDGWGLDHESTKVTKGAKVLTLRRGLNFRAFRGISRTSRSKIRGEVRYLLSDGLGAVRQAVDDSGAVTAYNEFDPYGKPLVNRQSEIVNPYGFTGEWWQWANRALPGGDAARLRVPSPGLYTVTLQMREDGLRIDRRLLTTATTTLPAGFGPPKAAVPPARHS
jgi:hypothetical protein